jgi:uncharacterized protein GlcG (DUF336 family)
MSVEITLAGAEKAIEAGQAKAAEYGIAFTISVVDPGGHVVAVSRMVGAALASVELSQAKARTSVLFAQPTKALVAAVQPGAPLFGVETSTGTRLAFVAGGIPFAGPNGRITGAVGVRGGTPDHDRQVAEAALSALESAAHG